MSRNEEAIETEMEKAFVEAFGGHLAADRRQPTDPPPVITLQQDPWDSNQTVTMPNGSGEAMPMPPQSTIETCLVVCNWVI